MHNWDIKKPRNSNLSDNIMDQLTDLIARGKLKPGDRLPSERELSEAFGVSRTAIREAMKGLSKVGLFRIIPGKGTYIESGHENVNALAYPLLLTENDMDSLYEARELVQAEMARLAAERAVEADIEEIRQAIQKAKEAENLSEQAGADLEFDLAVARAARNTVLLKFLFSIQEFMRLTRMRFINYERYSSSIQDHSRILGFIEEGKAHEAGEAMKAHIRAIKNSIERESGS